MIPLRIMIALPTAMGRKNPQKCRVLQLHQASDWLRAHGAAGCCSAEFFAQWIKEKKDSPCEMEKKNKWKFTG